MAAVGHFGCPKFTLNHISGYFRSIQIFFWFFFTKWLPVAILDVRKSLSISFLAISDRYTTLIFLKFLTKWLPSAILDVRNSLWITFLAILDQYRFFKFFFIFFYKMAAGGHFGCPKNHFWSHFYPFHIDKQLKFFFLILTKWLMSAILDVRISLSMAFLAISDTYGTLLIFLNFWHFK